MSEWSGRDWVKGTWGLRGVEEERDKVWGKEGKAWGTVWEKG